MGVRVCRIVFFFVSRVGFGYGVFDFRFKVVYFRFWCVVLVGVLVWFDWCLGRGCVLC